MAEEPLEPIDNSTPEPKPELSTHDKLIGEISKLTSQNSQNDIVQALALFSKNNIFDRENCYEILKNNGIAKNKGIFKELWKFSHPSGSLQEELTKMRILMTEQVAQHFDKGFDYEHTE